MNCKPGDLAFVVRSRAGNLGRMVRCIQLASEKDFASANVTGEGPVWIVDRPMAILCPWINKTRFVHLAPDEFLRPIRPDGITDSEVSELFSPSPAKESEKV